MSSSSKAGGRALVRTVSTPKRKRARMYLSRPMGRLMGTPNGVHQFKRVTSIDFPVNDIGITVGGVTGPGFGIQFLPSQLVIANSAGGAATVLFAGFAELPALFDQLKIVKAIVRFRSRNDSANSNVNRAIEICTAIDPNESNAPAVIGDLQQYGTFKSNVIEPGGKQHNVTLKPQWTELVYYTALLNGYASKTGYIRSDYDIPHYGLKGFILGSSSTQALQVEVEYLLEMKNTK